MTVSQWADKYRYLSPESSAKPGKYRSEFAPYQREWMDSFNDKSVSMTVLMVASQLGKSECINNGIGFFMSADPAPILMVQPTTQAAEAYSKERVAPMIRDTPELTNLVRDPKSRNSGNTVDMKQFPGGSLALVGANAPTGLAGRPRRVVLMDEIDRFPPSAGTEGDPCKLAIRRTESFWNAVVVATSTPTIKRISRIEKEYGETDQRQWFCPCPACGHYQTMKWSGVQWPQGKPEEAAYVCEKCETRHDDTGRMAMVRAGEWRPTQPFRGKRGYHLNGIASPFPCKSGYKSRLHQMASEFIEAKKGGSFFLRTWVNTFLAETWEEEGDTIEADPLLKRCEEYDAECPDGVVLITAGVDIQDSWIEGEAVGWGVGEESWVLGRFRVPGSPEVPSTWQAVDEFLMRRWGRKDGGKLGIACTFIDSGAHTQTVYRWVKPRQVRNVYACKGIAGGARPLVSRFSKHKTTGTLIFPVGVDTAKELIYSRLKIDHAGPGYMHFPKGLDIEYFMQLTSEKKTVRVSHGLARSCWEKIRTRNEALDCRVYATAALACKNYNLEKLATSVAKRGFQPSNDTGNNDVTQSQAPDKPRGPSNSRVGPRRGSSFVSGWRRW